MAGEVLNEVPGSPSIPKRPSTEAMRSMIGRPSGLIMIMPAQPPRMVGVGGERQAVAQALAAERHVALADPLLELVRLARVGGAQFHPDKVRAPSTGVRRVVAGRHQLEEAGRLEAAFARHHVREIAEDPQALQGQPRLVLVGVVHSHQGPRLAGGPGAQVAPIEEPHVLGAHPGGTGRRCWCR